MLKIRLARFGKKHQPTYRVVVTPKEQAVGGHYLDWIGNYNPIAATFSVDEVKAIDWLNKGAQPSERLARLMSKAGLTHQAIIVKNYQPKPRTNKQTVQPTTETKTESVVKAAEPLEPSEPAESTPESAPIELETAISPE